MPYQDGVFVEPTNDDRAGWAQAAVEVYAAETRTDPREQEIGVEAILAGDEDEKEHAEEVMADLLCDLQHLADRLGLDWDVLTERGERNHDEEMEEAR